MTSIPADNCQILSVTTSFALKAAVECRQLSRFLAKMTLDHESALFRIEKIRKHIFNPENLVLVLTSNLKDFNKS